MTKPLVIYHANCWGGLRSVHCERISDTSVVLIIDTVHQRACYSIGTVRAQVTVAEMWTDQVNRRSEAQRRRWNALTPAQRKRRRR